MKGPMVKLAEVSRAVAHALRHEPWIYELELDDEGWVPTEALLAALRDLRTDWDGLDEADLARMVEQSEKKRFELGARRIPALYGHSTPQRLAKEPAEPPAVLYHGTSPVSATRIGAEGLRPMGRQYVHLSTDVGTAVQVGRRKAREPVILVIRAREAASEGVMFYRGNELVWLADAVPARFIRQ